MATSRQSHWHSPLPSGPFTIPDQGSAAWLISASFQLSPLNCAAQQLAYNLPVTLTVFAFSLSQFTLTLGRKNAILIFTVFCCLESQTSSTISINHIRICFSSYISQLIVFQVSHSSWRLLCYLMVLGPSRRIPLTGTRILMNRSRQSLILPLPCPRYLCLI